MSLIKLEKVSKIYQEGQEIKALDNFDLEIEKGEFVAVMGASGSGKSTLLNLLGLLDRPTAGKYFLNNKETNKFSANQLNRLRNQEIGFVFQTFNLLPRFSALDNVILPLIYNSNQPVDRNRAIKLMEELDLRERLGHTPAQLSGGEKQRVALARALINKPSLILADEPTGNLDSQTGQKIMKLIAKLHQKENLTIVLVTHEEPIAKYGQRTIQLKDGRVI